MRLLPSAKATVLFATSVACCLFCNLTDAVEQNDSVKPLAHAALTVRPNTTTEFDLAKLLTGGRVVAVSSGALAFSGRMIDDNLQTVFRFSGSDLHPTVILELAENAPLDRVSSIFDHEQNATLDVYLVNELPKNLRNLNGAQLFNCVVDPARPGEGGADLQATNARYVVFRWTREHKTQAPFWVAELCVFSHVASTSIPPDFSEDEIHLTGETTMDFSNKLGVIADPPTIAAVSP